MQFKRNLNCKEGNCCTVCEIPTQGSFHPSGLNMKHCLNCLVYKNNSVKVKKRKRTSGAHSSLDDKAAFFWSKSSVNHKTIIHQACRRTQIPTTGQSISASNWNSTTFSVLSEGGRGYLLHKEYETAKDSPDLRHRRFT